MKKPARSEGGRRAHTSREALESIVHELQVHQVELLAQNEELKRVQLALEDSRDKYLDLYEFAPVSYFTLGPDTTIVEVNRNGCTLLGAPRQALIGRPFVRHVSRDNRSTFEGHRDGVIRQGRPSTCELRLVREDASNFEARLDSTSLKGDGSGTGIRIAVTDVSERRRAEEERMELQRQLLQVQKLESLGVLAGGVAHDFNNLLTSILGNLGRAREGLIEGTPTRARIEQAMQATERAADLTRQMLAYSGRGHFVLERVDLGEVVRNHSELLRSAASWRISFSQKLADVPVPVIADDGQMQQVLMNLFTNATEAIGDRSGAVVLATGLAMCEASELGRGVVEGPITPGRFAWLEVSDTGSGMDEATQRRMFEPFFTTKLVGRGLGMPAVLGIVKAHGGTLLVDSQVGRGTTIRVLLPIALGHDQTAEAAPILSEAPANAPPPPPRTILVVDDEESVREVAVSLVEFLGHVPLAAADGAEAIEVFRTHPEIAVVLLDLTMPGMDGVRVFTALREVRPEVRVLFCSGYDQPGTLEELGRDGPAGFLQKPYAMDALESELKRVLASP